MKKKIITIGIIILVLSIMGLYCYKRDNIRFKMSYEFINQVELTNGKKIKVSIPYDNRIKYINEEELLKLLNNGTGVLYMGYNTCPWCRNAVPILIDSVLENEIDTIYYVDIHSANLKKISKELYKILDEYLKVTDDGTKVIAVPDVYTLKNGQIVGHHRGCVEGYKNPYKKMTAEQKDELKKIYDEMIGAIK